MMGHLSDTIVNNDDPAMVEAGAPAYLLMIDSLISQDPDAKELLTTATLLYTAYADVFVTDEDRAGKLAANALNYAEKAICLSDRQACSLTEKPYDDSTSASPEGSMWMEKMHQGAAQVADQTQNRVTFRFYPGGVMGNDPEYLLCIRQFQSSFRSEQ